MILLFIDVYLYVIIIGLLLVIFSIHLLIAIVSKGGMDGGDSKLFAVIGLVLGLSMTVINLVLASFVGTIVGICLRV